MRVTGAVTCSPPAAELDGAKVELRGLEPLTPCLHSMARLSSTVCGLARSGLSGPPGYSNVQILLVSVVGVIAAH